MHFEDFTDAPIPPDVLAELEAILDEPGVSYDQTRVRTREHGCDVVVDASWSERGRTPGRDSTSHRVRRTLVYLHRPQARLPEFQILPKSGFTGGMLSAASRLLGVPTLELEHAPEVADRYSIVTANAESVRLLLETGPLRTLALVDDLELRFGARGVVASRTRGGLVRSDIGRDERLDEEGRRLLLEDATTVSGPMIDDPEVSRRAADAVSGNYAEEAARTYRDTSATGGLLGRMIRSRLVTHKMCQALRDQTPPRTDVPEQIARRAWKGTTFPLLIVSMFAVVFPAIGMLLLAKTAPDGDDRAVGAIFTGVGGLAAIVWFFIMRHRRIRRRLVRRGRAVDATVTRVERTNTSVDGDPIHRIHFEVGGGDEPLVVKVGSTAAKSARRMLESGRATWVLIDPMRPARGLWLEGWSIESTGD